MPIFWICKNFKELNVEELYTILQLRSEIFVVEQNCPYQDLDGKDLKGYHLMAFKDHILVAYTRLLPSGISYKEPSIGRVVVKQTERGTGLGYQLMKRSIDECYRLFGSQSLKIGAQLYLKHFYELLGFVQCSDVYDEDGIEHIEMIKNQ